MIPIKIDQPGVIQYLAAAGDGINTADPATPFQVPFYIYDVTALSVYLTPAGEPANDAANLLVYDTDYFGASYADPTQYPAPGGGYYYGFIALTSSSFPTGTNANDTITIFYDFGSATIIPKYPLCSTADPIIDSILPVLPPNCTWVKSSNGSKIQAVAMPTITPITTVANSAAKYIDVNGNMQSSNTILTSTTINNISYDNVTGINNLAINGDLNAKGNLTSENLEALSSITTNDLSVYSIIRLYDKETVNTTRIISPQSYNTNIRYYLPPSQASVVDSFFVNDGTGKLSWLSPNNITTVGHITSGTWDAGSVSATGNITSTGNISAAEIGGNGYFSGSVATKSLVMAGTSSSPSANSMTITSPNSYTDNYTYYLPDTIGTDGDILSLASAQSNVARLVWNAFPQSVKAWVRFHAEYASPGSGNPPYAVIPANGSYNILSVTRISTGIYDINFGSSFTSGTSYSWQATGYSASSSGVNVGIFNILQLHSSFGNGQDPQPGSCRMVLYNDSGLASDPILPVTPPQIAPDVCIAFFGT